MKLDNNSLNVNDNIIFIADNMSYDGKIIEKNINEDNIIDFVIELKNGSLLRKNNNQLNVYYIY